MAKSRLAVVVSMDNLTRHLENTDKSEAFKSLWIAFSVGEGREMKRDPGQAAWQPHIFASRSPSLQYNDFREVRSIRSQSNNDLIYFRLKPEASSLSPILFVKQW